MEVKQKAMNFENVCRIAMRRILVVALIRLYQHNDDILKHE